MFHIQLRAPSRSRWAATLLIMAGLTALMLEGIFSPSHASAAQPSVGLGTASSFAVLAGSTVTNTGPTVVSGDLGVAPGSAVTGFPPGVVIGGTQHNGDAVALQAQSDLTTAYNDAAGRTPATAAPADIGGQTLVAGVYHDATSMALTGTVTLNAQGNPDAVFVFQAGSTLITASNSTVGLINGAQACNVFWQVGSSATLGTGTSFVGNILALTSITAQTNTSVSGRLLARNGAVTLDSNMISRPGCTTGTGPTPAPSATASPSVSPSTSASATTRPTSTSSASPTRAPSASATSTGVGSPGPTTTATTPAGAPSSSQPAPRPSVSATRTGAPGPSPATTPTRTPTPARTGATNGPTPHRPYVIPPGFPNTGAGGAAPSGDAGATTLLVAGAAALLVAGAASSQAVRRRRRSSTRR